MSQRVIKFRWKPGKEEVDWYRTVQVFTGYQGQTLKLSGEFLLNTSEATAVARGEPFVLGGLFVMLPRQPERPSDGANVAGAWKPDVSDCESRAEQDELLDALSE